MAPCWTSLVGVSQTLVMRSRGGTLACLFRQCSKDKKMNRMFSEIASSIAHHLTGRWQKPATPGGILRLHGTTWWRMQPDSNQSLLAILEMQCDFGEMQRSVARVSA